MHFKHATAILFFEGDRGPTGKQAFSVDFCQPMSGKWTCFFSRRVVDQAQESGWNRAYPFTERKLNFVNSHSILLWRFFRGRGHGNLRACNGVCRNTSSSRGWYVTVVLVDLSARDVSRSGVWSAWLEKPVNHMRCNWLTFSFVDMAVSNRRYKNDLDGGTWISIIS